MTKQSFWATKNLTSQSAKGNLWLTSKILCRKSYALIVTHLCCLFILDSLQDLLALKTLIKHNILERCWCLPTHQKFTTLRQRRVGNYVIWSVVQICLKSDLAKFLKNFQDKAFCKKAWQWRDSNWGLPGDRPGSLPLYQHDVLWNWDSKSDYKLQYEIWQPWKFIRNCCRNIWTN